MRDLRKYAKQTTVRLILGGISLVVFIGDGLIFWIYGKEAAIFGLVCIAGGLSPLILIWLVLLLMDWIVRRANQDES